MGTRSRRLEIYEAILASGILPLFYTPEVSVAREVRAACDRAGATVLEFTARGPAALAVLEALADVNGKSPGVALGAGSEPDAGTAALFLAAGAEFIVTPVLDPEIARLCNRRKVAYLPGCATLTEVAAAEELGAEIVKVFPASQLGGPGYQLLARYRTAPLAERPRAEWLRLGDRL